MPVWLTWKALKAFGGKILDFVFNYWSQIACAIVAAWFTMIIVSNDYEREIIDLESAHAKTVIDIKTKKDKECEDQKNLTKEADEEIQRELTINLNKRDAIIGRLRREAKAGTSCRAVSYASGQGNGNSSSKELSSGVGEHALAIDAERVTYLFSWADDNTSKLLACQDFIREVYALNGRPLDK